jgi:hypothetical protein
MNIQLKTIFGDLIFEGDFSSISDAVKAALAAKKTLSSANLSYANLRSANLSSADLSSADLSSANLSSADLSSADLRYANLRSAILSSANLSSANLSSADLSSADLSSADLRYANLSYANLRSADLSSADLSSANLSYADLSSADLRYANLSSANLSYAQNSELAVAMTRILPEGNIVGWKKCRDAVIVKVLIPTDAKRSSAFGRKCRAEFVRVLEVVGAETATSLHDGVTTYKAGEIVRSDKWCDDFTNECAGGIHFYITRLEAEQHQH